MKICLFSSYSEDSKIKNYIKFYLEELKKHNDKVIFITNYRNISLEDLKFLDTIGVEKRYVENHGLDFGMFYKELCNLKISDISQLTLANDSCLLIKNLNKIYGWINTCDYDYCGVTNSEEKLPHIQSYFLVIKQSAVKIVYDYFMKNKILNDLSSIIDIYEVGLSQHLLNLNIKIGSYYNCQKYQEGRKQNIYIYYAKELLLDGSPFLKKKVAFDTFRPHEKEYIKQIGYDATIDYKQLVKDIIYYEDDNININYLFS
jgi:lipopolysaccharide biosynthesis protein